MSNDHEATGPIRIDTTTTIDGMTITGSEMREITAEITLNADRLSKSDIATTHRSGVTIDTRGVASAVAERIDATLNRRVEAHRDRHARRLTEGRDAGRKTAPEDGERPRRHRS